MALSVAATAVFAEPSDLPKDIQQIFARHCYECHGPEKQKGELRLDLKTSTLKTDGEAIVVPGNATKSELYRRITLPWDDDEIMPNRGEPLSAAQIARIREWINQGAIWPETTAPAKHWAYVQPSRPELPKISNRRWAKNEIDQFILLRLDQQKLRPSPEADRARLLRRVFLDLTGLPPSPAQVAEFIADQSPNAYEQRVDQLLKSPHYGERWARPWLDLARYADSSGFQKDDLWDLWPYRDWVVGAFNADMPFDQFTIEQIAGDLLPGATREQKVATGFNRATAINVEAGSDQEESRVNQVIDRVNTVGTVWLGSTVECAQCHNHKYDPFSQKEYYQLFAFFNNTAQETEFASSTATTGLKFVGPYVQLPDQEVDARRAALLQQIQKLDQESKAAADQFLAQQEAWERSFAGELHHVTQSHVLKVADFETASGATFENLKDDSVVIGKADEGAIPQKDLYTITVRPNLAGITGFKLEILAEPSVSRVASEPQTKESPFLILTDFAVHIAAAFGERVATQPVKLRNAKANCELDGFSASGAIDADPQSGWAIGSENKDHWIRFETSAPVEAGDGRTFVFKLQQNNDGSRLVGRLRLSAITGAPSSKILPSDIVTILSTPADKRDLPRKKRLTEYYLSNQPEWQEMKEARSRLEDQLGKVPPLRTLIMQEMKQPRSSTTFVRGNFLEKGGPVQPDVPGVLHPLPPGPRNRLTLAQWLVSANNPLVARVTVNRWWAEFFGHGLVATAEDFGLKGEAPTHPELLDWLAVEFMQRNWSMKRIHRLIVTSATYRQSSHVSSELLAKDDTNTYYARGPRFRLDSEMVRDNALAAAGLLSLKLGGPPVRPYQPPGIWGSKLGGARITYEISEGEDRYRRGIYTVWKRTSPYPSFMNFDAPNRYACAVKRTRSNTPLQALTLLNDPVYVEAAVALARRTLLEKPRGTTEEKIRHAFQLCLARAPNEREEQFLFRLYREQLQSSRSHPLETEKAFRELLKIDGLDAAQQAAWYSVASAVLNLDEMITKL
jgi:hypothetical protein